MNRRYLFLCPDEKSASGGVAVIYDIVALLNRAGYCSAILHNSPNAGYPDYPTPVPMFYTKTMRNIYWRYLRPRGRVKIIRDWLTPTKQKLHLVKLNPTDVIVAPEFQIAEAIEGFSDLPIAVLVQNPFSLMISYQRALERGLDPKTRVKFWFGIAEVCQTHMAVLGLEPSRIFPVSMKPHEFPYQEQKEKLITYMPRKRPWEAKLISEALVRRGKLFGYRIEAIDNIPRSEVAMKLARSLIFISLLKREALGFPAAEAMASGCIVVGFDGLGTAEYFDSEVGFPVTEGDVAGVILEVERTVAEYESDPSRLDAMRARGAERIGQRYSTSAFENAAIDAWNVFHNILSEVK